MAWIPAPAKKLLIMFSLELTFVISYVCDSYEMIKYCIDLLNNNYNFQRNNLIERMSQSSSSQPPDRMLGDEIARGVVKREIDSCTSSLEHFFFVSMPIVYYQTKMETRFTSCFVVKRTEGCLRSVKCIFIVFYTIGSINNLG